MVENKATFKRLVDALPHYPIRFVILLSDEDVPTHDGLTILNWSQFQQLGAGRPLQPVPQSDRG